MHDVGPSLDAVKVAARMTPAQAPAAPAAAGDTEPADHHGQITLSGVTAVGHHGVFDFERRDGQPFVVDAVLHLDFRRAAASDDVRDTAHYGEVAERITGLDHGRAAEPDRGPGRADRRGRAAKFPVDAVDITVHKPKAPIEVQFGDVSVSVRRSRHDQP